MKTTKKAFPEGILNGNWEVKSGVGSVIISKKILSIPTGCEVSEQHIRNHEYFHIKFSPLEIGKVRSDDDIIAIKALEDCRVNMLGVNSGVDISKAITAEDISKFHIAEDEMQPFVKVCLLISTWGYDAQNELLPTLSPFEKNIVEDTMVKIEKVINLTDSFEQVKQIAFNLVDLFKIPEGTPEDIGESVRKSVADENDDGSDVEEDEEPEEDESVKLSEKFESDEDETSFDDPRDNSGSMEIVKCPLPVKNVWKKRKNSDTGYNFRHPERVLTDMRCFSSMRKAPFIGTILIDCSGSMRLSVEEIEQIVREGCGCVVAGYSGRGSHGTLQIMSENGNIVSKIPEFDYGNVIDVPALKWLSQHRGNKIWISDGKVTGNRDISFGTVIRESAELVIKHDIKNVLTIEDAVEYIQEIKSKHL